MSIDEQELTNCISKWAAERKAEMDRVNGTRGAIFEALEKAGIASLYVPFDGYGDSGQINFDESEVTGANGLKVLDLNLRMIHVGEKNLEDLIGDFCYAHMEENHGGWEDNDGAYGDFTFDVSARTITYDHNTRFTDSVNDTHEL